MTQEIDNIIARIILRKPPIINQDRYHFITDYFLKREFKIPPGNVKNTPDVSNWFCLHRIMRYEMAYYDGQKPY